MANPIRRLVQLVLDRAAAAKMQADAKAALGGVEKSVTSLGTVARRVGAAIVAALSVRALVEFGKAAVTAAADSERSWTRLRGTIEAAGQSFGAIEGRIRATASAFQDATIHGDEEFADGLQRLVALTGDVEASLQNMGLVANVAARFFDGQLEPAIELVGKTMNGNLGLLKRMGIEAKSAQEALELLAQRGFNGATEEANTFAGQAAQLRNMLGEMREAIGNVLVESGQGVSILGTLRAAVVALTASITENRDELRGGFTAALTGTVIVIDAVYRGLRGVAELMAGTLLTAFGAVTAVAAGFNKMLALTAEGAELVTRALGLKGATLALDQFGKKLDATRAELLAVGKTGLGLLGEGAGRFTQRTQVAEDLLAGIRNPNGRASRAPSLLNAKPIAGKNAKGAGGLPNIGAPELGLSITETTEALEAQIPAVRTLADQFEHNDNAVLDFEEGMRRLEVQTRLNTGAFDENGQRLDATTLHLEALRGEAELLEAALLEITPDDPRWEGLNNQLMDVRGNMANVAAEAKLMADAAGLAGEVVGAALTGGLVPFAKAKARANLIQAAEETAHGIAAAFSVFGAADAAKHFALAAKFAGIAAAWGTLAKGAGAAGIGGGGGASGAAGRAGSRAAQRAEQPSPEVTIVLSGPGFHALNPAVQKVVLGSMQQARERYGENFNVKLQLGSA